MAALAVGKSMPEIKLQDAYRVDIIESERGWGSKIDETKYFTDEVEARAFVKEYNKDRYQTNAPDWYMIAEYVGKVR